MSRFYEASQKSQKESRETKAPAPETARASVDTGQSVILGVAQSCRLVNFEIPAESRLVALTEQSGGGAEKFRVLAARLEKLREAQKSLKFVQITSAVSGEGKTLVSANLALTLALKNSKVLLVEGDLRRPHLPGVLGLSQVPGIADWWSGARPDINSLLYQLQEMPLWLLLAGGAHRNPAKILASPRFAKVFAQFSRQFDWIIVDSPELLDVSSWSKLTDGTLLVVREGVTPMKALRNALVSVESAKLIGVVCNDTTEAELASGSTPDRAQGEL